MSVAEAHSTAESGRRTHFVDSEINAAMAERGYVVLPERLARDRVAALADLYDGVVEEVGRDTTGAFMPSMMIQRRDLRTRLWDGVRELLAPVFDPWFEPGTTEVIGGSYVSKPASENSSRNPHQDPSVFDETRVVSLSLWIPLVDSDEDNGTLRLLPGSHRMANHVRPPDVESLDAELIQTALRESVPIPMEAGQVLVIDGAGVHHSPPNRSERERVAAICALKERTSSMWYVKSDAGAVRGTAAAYDVGVEMYRSGDLVRPDLDAAPLVARLPYRPATVADLDASRSSS